MELQEGTPPPSRPGEGFRIAFGSAPRGPRPYCQLAKAWAMICSPEIPFSKLTMARWPDA